MDGYEITTAAGTRTWAAGDEANAREQHIDAFPDEPIVSVTKLDPWWIYIDRQYSAKPLAVGPYPTEALAVAAFEGALLIECLCQEDCLDAECTNTQPDETYEQVLIDPTDPDHFG